jgi:hypothetical protein
MGRPDVAFHAGGLVEHDPLGCEMFPVTVPETITLRERTVAGDLAGSPTTGCSGGDLAAGSRRRGRCPEAERLEFEPWSMGTQIRSAARGHRRALGISQRPSPLASSPRVREMPRIALLLRFAARRASADVWRT